MRNANTLSVLAVTAAAALLAAAPAMAHDPDPREYRRCTVCGWTVQTTGVAPCDGDPDNTCITYTVTGAGVPDHLGVFLRAEAGLPLSTSPSSTTTNPTTCSGDSVFGLGSPLLCHERVIHFSNRTALATTFTLKVAGKRNPIVTTLVVKKGSSQCAYPIEGIGFEVPPPPASCVNNCGNFSPKQSVRKTEKFNFEGCIMQFDYDADGSIPAGGFTVYPDPTVNPAPVCTPTTGSISDIVVQTGAGTFGDGWLSSGSDSCSTRMVGGTYYTVCR
jgi:hypothetical protein